MVIMNNVNTTERLIQEVRSRPPLWDQRNLNYHNRVVVNALWQDIADLLQVNKETVKVKWKGLRDTYRRELKKQRSSVNLQNGAENPRDPSWTHYSSMNFLREYMGSNSNHNDLFHFQSWPTDDMVLDEQPSPTNEALSPFVPAEPATTKPARPVEWLSGDDAVPVDPKPESESSDPGTRDSPEPDTAAPKKRLVSRLSKLKEHRLRSRLSRGKHPKVVHNGSSRCNDDSDDDLYFFKSLIPYVKSLPPTRKLYLRSEIHNIVLREIMADTTNGSHSVIPLEHVTVGLNA